MNGPQDLGGQMGFGPVAPEIDEPVFHAGWERRALGLTLAITLLELLVSIAVIAVLAGLMLPALSYAKEKARRAQCIHNLKQVTLAMHEFASDHEVYPWRLPPMDGGSQTMTQAAKSFRQAANPPAAMAGLARWSMTILRLGNLRASVGTCRRCLT